MRKTLLIKLAAALFKEHLVLPTLSCISIMILNTAAHVDPLGKLWQTNMLKCCPECLGVGSRLENYLLPHLTKLDRRFHQQQLYYFNSLCNQQNLQMKFFFFIIREHKFATREPMRISSVFHMCFHHLNPYNSPAR